MDDSVEWSRYHFYFQGKRIECDLSTLHDLGIPYGAVLTVQMPPGSVVKCVEYYNKDLLLKAEKDRKRKAVKDRKQTPQNFLFVSFRI